MRFSYRAYVLHVRKQSPRVQQLHAFVFASVITGITAFLILYYDYGFFHDKYTRKEESSLEEIHTDPLPSPTSALGNFFGEVKYRFGALGSGSADLLHGKDVYKNNEGNSDTYGQ